MRADGCMPDRVQIDGKSVMGPGQASSPMADHAWDNGPFAALLLTAAVRARPSRIPSLCTHFTRAGIEWRR